VNKFQEHIADYAVDGQGPAPVFEFKTTEDLLALEIVKRYSSEKGHEHFCISDNRLMQIKDDSLYWWVVGSIKNPNEVDLPKWYGGKYKAEFSDGSIRILSAEDVCSSCGDELTLCDGTKAKRIRSDG